jgi:hypothetical protein
MTVQAWATRAAMPRRLVTGMTNMMWIALKLSRPELWSGSREWSVTASMKRGMTDMRRKKR